MGKNTLRKDLTSLEVPGVFDIKWVSAYYDIVNDKNGFKPYSLIPTDGYWLSMKLVPGASTIEYKANYDQHNFDQGNPV